ncbi:hypothetical protein PLESTB_000315100 [Pleodorina starrii]|uniref:GDT1 family protein n=1 Tax=Pleodorina starrii TaxID=330485 RepID=A0A9W6EZ27_9CHLO|nr:hypothetical protein PLESTM_001725300 [Pleodorina starrii]GLC49845.1 hypothetical protein PLESTB_000315100 [Pleodorina starrii]GLC77032.1 hypothetical protein PLESTF_001875900 [Pleodorina starrii]
MLRNCGAGSVCRVRSRTQLRVAAVSGLSPCIFRHTSNVIGLRAPTPQPDAKLGSVRADGDIRCRSSAGAGSSIQPDAGSNKSGSPLPWILMGLSAVALGAYIMSEPGQALKEVLINGPLGKSGFFAAFSLIFLSEIGDKTFFIAALLAMKIGRWMSFFGSVSALAVMTVISVAIGAICSRVPDALKSSIPVGELAGIALLVFFGIKTLRDGLSKPEEGPSTADEELADAESAVQQVEGGKAKQQSPLAVFFEVATLIFLAEWGDRSMLATIALGAAQNPVGVAVGAIGGHAIATGIAVLGGGIASKYVSERTVNIVSGLLFLLFAAATAFSMF